jgi:hypothetical protein
MVLHSVQRFYTMLPLLLTLRLAYFLHKIFSILHAAALCPKAGKYLHVQSVCISDRLASVAAMFLRQAYYCYFGLACMFHTPTWVSDQYYSTKYTDVVNQPNLRLLIPHPSHPLLPSFGGNWRRRDGFVNRLLSSHRQACFSFLGSL